MRTLLCSKYIECLRTLRDNRLIEQIGLFGEISDYFLFYLWTCAKWYNVGLTHY